ncbi:MAG: methionyl-tRNA formyltransferase [Alphaproteobacteria bacterium]|nr:methionyl-tRNA formyltransferase [Alphaproteobacteria bacterium]
MKPEITRIAFMGTPDFAVHILNSLLKANYNVVAVYSQPPRPVGRGYKVSPSPVHQFAESRKIPVYTPLSLKTEGAQAQWESLNVDVAIVAAYGLLLPKAILEAPRWGCVNVHASLLPRWRGAAPIQRAILAGDSETGVTIMKMDEGLDTGDILAMKETPIPDTMTTFQLRDILSQLGAAALLEALPLYLGGALQSTPQPQTGVTYAEKLSKTEGELDWQLPASVLMRKIRALNPWPGTWFHIGDDRIKVLEAQVIPLSVSQLPGTIIDNQLTIACGQQALRLLLVQKVGKAPLCADEFLRGYELPSRQLLHAAI